MNAGLTQYGWKQFKDLLAKANHGQLELMIEEIREKQQFVKLAYLKSLERAEKIDLEETK